MFTLECKYSNFVPLFQVALAILGLLNFNMSFRINLSISAKIGVLLKEEYMHILHICKTGLYKCKDIQLFVVKEEQNLKGRKIRFPLENWKKKTKERPIVALKMSSKWMKSL